jgi:hypothetical protein
MSLEPPTSRRPPCHGDFRCPLCGSSYFTTLGDINRPDATGQCRGKATGPGVYAGCTFTWLRRNDAEVFS